MKLILVRHGETSSNVIRALDTAHPGADLTERGRQQADALVAAFEDRAPEALFSSPRARARQTAAPLAAAFGIEPALVDGLVEIDAGDVEMRTDAESRAIYISTLRSWTLGDHDVRMPGAESGHEFLARFDNAIHAISQSGAETAIVFGHSAAIHQWVANRADLSAWGETAYRPIHNTGGVELKGEPGNWTILDWHPTPFGTF